MKPDKNTKVGAIMQLDADDEHVGALFVAEHVESWGVRGYVPTVPGSLNRSWSALEPTGGVIVVGRDGKPFALPVAPPKHHP